MCRRKIWKKAFSQVSFRNTQSNYSVKEGLCASFFLVDLKYDPFRRITHKLLLRVFINYFCVCENIFEVVVVMIAPEENMLEKYIIGCHCDSFGMCIICLIVLKICLLQEILLTLFFSAPALSVSLSLSVPLGKYK